MWCVEMEAIMLQPIEEEVMPNVTELRSYHAFLLKRLDNIEGIWGEKKRSYQTFLVTEIASLASQIADEVVREWLTATLPDTRSYVLLPPPCPSQ